MKCRFAPVFFFAICLLGASLAQAESIIVSNYGVGATAMPYAIAFEKGFFKEAGADIDRIIDAEGDVATSTLAKLDVAYAEIALAAVVNAKRSGKDLVIVSENVPLVADYVWVALKSSPIVSVNDMKGRRLGFSTIGSTSETLDRLWLAQAGIAASDVMLSRTGGLGVALTFLDRGALDVIPIEEPVWTVHAAKYKKIESAATVAPNIGNVVGVASRAAVKDRGGFIRAVLNARRRAIAFMRSDPGESASIIARIYKIEPAIAKRVIESLLDSEKTHDRSYWSDGSLQLSTLQKTLDAQKLVDPGIGEVRLRDLLDDKLISN